MIAISSGDLMKEFTLYADRANDEGETFIVQRPASRNVVLMSMETYNAIQKKLYEAKRKKEAGD